uniref:Uncharacterized protein n=1 Tax=Avena sativa TaxID=4498 RepID=A0ACD5YZH1_AVESA
MSGEQHETINVVGPKRASVCEAQSEAAAAALRQISSDPLNIKVLDPSHVRCEEMKLYCKKVFKKTIGMQHLLTMLLSGWADCTHEIEKSYDPLFHFVTQDPHHPGNLTAKLIRLHVGKQLLKIAESSLQRFSVLDSEVTALKIRQRDARTLIRDHLNDGPLVRILERPCEAKVSMKFFLRETMLFLGWDQPEFSTSCQPNNVYVCEVYLQQEHSNVIPNTGRVCIKGDEEVYEARAMESAAAAAMLYLEKSMCIRVADLNYTKRSQAEVHIAEVDRLFNTTSSLVAEVRSEWEEVMEAISICDDHYRKMVMKHPVEDHSNNAHKVKLECAEVVAQLYKTCLADMRDGQCWFKSFSKSLSKE